MPSCSGTFYRGAFSQPGLDREMLDHYFYVLMYYEVEQKKRKPKYYLNIEFFLFILTDPITKKAAITFSTGRFVGPAN